MPFFLYSQKTEPVGNFGFHGITMSWRFLIPEEESPSRIILNFVGLSVPATMTTLHCNLLSESCYPSL